MIKELDFYPLLESRQFFAASISILRVNYLTKIWHKSKEEIYFWAADPKTNGETRQNPIDKLVLTLRTLHELGRPEVARAGVQLLADVIDCDLSPREEFAPDKETLPEEFVQDLKAVVAFQEAINAGDPEKELRRLLQDAIEELKDTLTLALDKKRRSA